MNKTDINPEVSFDNLDTNLLTRVPLVPLETYVSLIKALAGVAFDDPSLDRAKARLVEVADEAETVLVARIGDDIDVMLERKFDLFVDRVWGIVRSELEFWTVYLHEGVGLFSPEQRAKIEYEQNRKQAEAASAFVDRLFGPEGSEFLRTTYPQQAAAMSVRLRWIEERGLGETFISLVGPRLAKLVAVCQDRYETMIAERAARSSGPIGDRNLLNRKLRRAIKLYAHAVIGTLDETDASAQRIELALRPLVAASMPRRASETGFYDEGEAELDEVDEGAGEDEDPGEDLDEDLDAL